MSVTQTSIDVYDKVSTVLKELSTCTEKKQIDSIFSKGHITDPKEKIKLLYKCMGIECVYGTPEQISDEDEYEFECAVFVEGTWRLLN